MNDNEATRTNWMALVADAIEYGILDGIGTGPTRLLFILARNVFYSGDHIGECRYTNKVLAQKARISEQAMSNHMKKLIEANFVERIEYRTHSGFRRRTAYKLKLETLLSTVTECERRSETLGCAPEVNDGFRSSSSSTVSSTTEEPPNPPKGGYDDGEDDGRGEDSSIVTARSKESGFAADHPAAQSRKQKMTKMKFDPDFLEWWGHRPRCPGWSRKADTYRLWKELEEGGELPELGVMISALESWKQTEKWTKDGGRYISHSSTYLNQRMFDAFVETGANGEQVQQKRQAKPGDHYLIPWGLPGEDCKNEYFSCEGRVLNRSEQVFDIVIAKWKKRWPGKYDNVPSNRELCDRKYEAEGGK